MINKVQQALWDNRTLLCNLTNAVQLYLHDDDGVVYYYNHDTKEETCSISEK